MRNLKMKEQLLNAERGDLSLREYVELVVQSDPNFFRWLFDAELANDFESSLTEEQVTEYNNWLETL